MNGHADPFGGGFDVTVPDVGLPQRHRRVAVAEQAGDDRKRHPLQHGVARECVPAVVEPHVRDAGAPTDAIPETKFAATRSGRVARRGEDMGAPAAGLARQDALGVGVEEYRLGAGLAVAQSEGVPVHLIPAEIQDLATSSAGQQEEPDDVGHRMTPVSLSKTCGVSVENPQQSRFSGDSTLDRRHGCSGHVGTRCSVRLSRALRSV